MNRRVTIVMLVFACASLIAYAHEGMIHVMGTVTALTENSVTVVTSENKSIVVVLVETTTYEKGTQPAVRKDLKIGDRVVIHAVKVKDALNAQNIRFSESKVLPSH